MKIAMIISGRISRYEVGLLKTLNNNNIHEIDLFVSINSEECEYINNAKSDLSEWIKGWYVSPYEIDKLFFDLIKPEEWEISKRIGNLCSCQLINNKYIPYNAMSMFFNDKNAFEMAKKYADDNNFEYDCYMKYRSDIIDTNIPEKLEFYPQTLISNTPICQFNGNGIYKVPIVCDAWAWGDRSVMSVYFSTYDYVLNKVINTDGHYFVNFEDNITDNIYENNIQVHFVKHRYYLDVNRRIFDKTWENGNITDTRNVNISGALEPIDIKSISKLDIPPQIQE